MLPTGTVTFLFTDIESSTAVLRELGPERYAEALADHRRVIRDAAQANGGVEVDTQGDAFFLAFPTADGAVAAATRFSEELAAGPLRVRAGLHTGTPLVADGSYVGEDVHLAARIAAAGHGGQVLVSGETSALAAAGLRGLGEHRLKDFDRPVVLFQVGDARFPPLRTIANTNLPHPTSSFVGRSREMDELRARLASGARLVTLTGPGGSGKTRLAIEAASALVGDYPAGVFWVGLAALRDPELVLDTIAQAVGAKDGVAEHIGERELLVLLDNLEHVIGAASSLASLLAACPNLTLLVTSRELLRIQGEVELSVPPLEEQEAVDLFCERSGMEPADEIAELCRRLDSLPLAVELAAARTRALAPAQILQRVAQRLDLLKGGRDADPRQQTLRATIEWSFDLLTPDELRLMRRLSVFAGGCTLDAAESVADADVDTLQSLVEKSLIRFAGGRYLVLETIRELAAEGLEADDADEVRLRHRAFFVALGQDGAQRLHTVEEAAESARLEPEHPNLRAAVAYALAACEPDDVGYIVGAVYPFLISHGHLAETTEWVEAALRLRDRLSEAALADLLAGGSEIARFAGDLDLAIALKNELVEVDAAPQRPNSRAATLADLAEIWVDCGDFAQARRYAQLSRDAGHGVRASLAFAEIALREGDLPEVEREAGAALAQLDEGSFNHACALEIAGEAARRAGDDVIAVDRFAAGLRSFAGLGDGGGTADCLEGLARLAASAGDEVRAGTLLGSAERLREVWGRRPIRADVPPPAVPSAARQAGRALTLDEAVEEALG